MFWSIDDQEFERTDQLAKGEMVVTADGRAIDVVGLAESTAHTGLAYNLSISGVHTYHVGDDEILVHNDCDPFDAVDSLRGADSEDVLDVIPDNWRVKSLKKGEGIRFLNPKKPGQAIIYEKGWAGHADPPHRGPYLRVSNGKDPAYQVPLAGNPTLP